MRLYGEGFKAWNKVRTNTAVFLSHARELSLTSLLGKSLGPPLHLLLTLRRRSSWPLAAKVGIPPANVAGWLTDTSLAVFRLPRREASFSVTGSTRVAWGRALKFKYRETCLLRRGYRPPSTLGREEWIGVCVTTFRALLYGGDGPFSAGEPGLQTFKVGKDCSTAEPLACQFLALPRGRPFLWSTMWFFLFGELLLLLGFSLVRECVHEREPGGRLRRWRLEGWPA